MSRERVAAWLLRSGENLIWGVILGGGLLCGTVLSSGKLQFVDGKL